MTYARAHVALRPDGPPEPRERVKAKRVLVLAALAALAGCSGGGGANPAPPIRAAVPGKTGTASVTFAMHWTAATAPTAASRRPAYVPATARSVSISVNGATPQYLNSPATTLAISAPAGVDTFTIQTFDEQNGLGNVLSKANISQTVVVDTANVLSATLNGVIASLKISLGTTFKAGTAASAPVNVAALDADGNTIVGPGDYSSPIQLSVVDQSSSGTLSLSSTLIQTPGQTSTLAYTGGTLASATIAAIASGVSTANAPVTPTPTIYEYQLANVSADPLTITRGSDGNMWFTEYNVNKIGKITPTGTITEYNVPTSTAGPDGITAGSDGNVWFTENGANKIGRITTTGVITEFSTFVPDAPGFITDGGDGNVWYGGQSDVGYQSETTPSAQGHYKTLSVNAGVGRIVRASDHELYFTEFNAGKIGHILSTSSTITETTVGGSPYGFVSGPDGNLWYSDGMNSSINQLAPGSSAPMKTFLTPTLSSRPGDIAVGNDGALWFTEGNGNMIGRITTSGAMSEYPIPTAAANATGIATAPDGSIWFIENAPAKIGRLVY
jgi:virginiamycin B lyase